ncbi:MAG: hypothetical protein AB1894_25335 [Chloroflexota bacterium]
MRSRIFVISMFLLVLIIVPYGYALQVGGTDFAFGGFLINPLDGNSYLAKMYQGWLGEWRMRLPYTADPGAGAYFFTFHLFLGHLARLTGLPLILVYHLTRLVGTVFLLLALYRFLIVQGVPSPWGIWAFVLAVFGSGLGWLAVPFQMFTSDLWVAEAYPFLSAYANAHFPLSLALLLFLLMLPEGRGHIGDASDWTAVVLALLLASMSPFGVVLVLVILGGLIAWELWPRLFTRQWIASRPRQAQADERARRAEVGRLSKLLRRFVAVLVGGGPWLLYDYWVTRVDPVFASWNAQNITPAPPAWDLLLSFSPALLLALPGAWFLLKNRQMAGRSWLVWVVSSLVMLALPLGLQRRFLMGLFVPLAGLAGFGLARAAEFLGLSRARLLASAVLILSLPTNLFVLLAAVHGAQTHDPLLYLSRDEARALEWIAANTPLDARILAAPELALFIPAHTGRRVIYGHPFETVRAQVEEQAVIQFFSGQNRQQAIDFLQGRGVGYILYGRRERALGSLPDLDGIITPLQNFGQLQIYQVDAP